MWLAGLLNVTLAAPVAWPVDAVPLKSGGWVQVHAPKDGVVPALTFAAPSGPDRAEGLTCAVPDPAAWEAWHTFFVAVEAEKLPATQARAAFGQDGGCVAEASWGATDATRNVVTLKIQATTPGKDAPVPVTTTLARREAGLLAARLAAAKIEADRRAIVVVEVAPTPAEPAPTAVRVAASGPDASEESARILYAARGWPSDGDPGFGADVDALRALVGAGHRPSDVVTRALTERRLRPGVLGDLALGWGFAAAQ